jgi:hypothetical protein
MHCPYTAHELFGGFDSLAFFSLGSYISGSLWLFGYGSLLNPDSRLKSLNFDADGEAGGANATGVDMQIRGWKREWNMCAPPPYEFIAVGEWPQLINSPRFVQPDSWQLLALTCTFLVTLRT